MSTLYITEYMDTSGHNQVPLEPPLIEQTVAISSSSASSNAFGPQTKLIRVHTDVICSVLVSPKGTAATTASGRMAANQTEYRGVSPGQILSVISNT